MKFGGLAAARWDGIRYPYAAAPPAHDQQPRRADHDEREALQLWRGEPNDDIGVSPDELDEEAFDPRQQQVPGEEEAGAKRLAVAPEPPGDEPHRDRLVDRRRMDGMDRRHGPVRVTHRPRPVPLDAVVAVAGELAADPPDRVAECERNAADVEQRQVEQPAPPRPRDDADGAADHAAVPDQARAREQRAGVAVLDDEVQLRAHDAADERGEHDLVGVVDGLAELLQPAGDDEAGREESEGEHHPEGLDRGAEDVDLGLHRDRTLARGLSSGNRAGWSACRSRAPRSAGGGRSRSRSTRRRRSPRPG